MARLPKTFRDAVSVAKWLHIRYLWIDSLCIIQDSIEDWTIEAASMRDVYKYSYGTIAATGASDSSIGLFFEHLPHSVPPLKVNIAWTGWPAGEYYGFAFDLWDENITEAPLNRRAWVVKERLLSPPVLHFARHQMFWECQELAACETFPWGLPKAIRDEKTSAKRYLGAGSQEFKRRHWQDIVHTYTRGLLTRDTDKCIAFHGLVEQAQVVANDTYIAGFWRHYIVQQLPWQILTHRPSARSSAYRAPSWSWLSVNDEVSMLDVSERDDLLLELLDVWV